MTDLFNNISEKNKEKLLKMLRAHTYNYTKNLKILSINRGENYIAIVDSGYIQIVQNDYNGEQFISDRLYEGAVFGPMFSIINNECDIITKEDSRVTIIDYDEIINNTDVNNVFYKQFIQNLLMIVSEKIKEKNERIKIITKKTIRNRLLEYFKLASNYNTNKTIYLPFSITELAEYLAIDRCAMSRELKNLKEEGFISIKNRKISLLY